jgi:hypothetical protein
MTKPSSDEKQPQKASNPHDGWLTRAQVAAELGYRSIFPIRKMEGQVLHPIRDARGWVFDPAEVAGLKAARTKPSPTGLPLSEGRLAARVFYLFDHGHELREIVEELEVAPNVVRDLWHEWLVGLEDGEMERRATAQQERRRQAEEKEMQALERRSEQEQRSFETTMATIAASIAGGKDTK